MRENKGQAPEEERKLPSPIPYDDEEEAEEDELEEFLFFRKLEENDGRLPKGMALSGCFTVLPIAALIIAAIFFLLRYMYL